MKIEASQEQIEKFKPTQCGTNKYPCKGKRREPRDFQFIRADIFPSTGMLTLMYRCKTCKRGYVEETNA